MPQMLLYHRHSLWQQSLFLNIHHERRTEMYRGMEIHRRYQLCHRLELAYMMEVVCMLVLVCIVEMEGERTHHRHSYTLQVHKKLQGRIPLCRLSCYTLNITAENLVEIF